MILVVFVNLFLNHFIDIQQLAILLNKCWCQWSWWPWLCWWWWLVLSWLEGVSQGKSHTAVHQRVRTKISAVMIIIVIMSSVHYGFCPLEKLTFKDLAKLTALAAIFKTKSYFRWDIWGVLFIQFYFLSHFRFSPPILLSFDIWRHNFHHGCVSDLCSPNTSSISNNSPHRPHWSHCFENNLFTNCTHSPM